MSVAEAERLYLNEPEFRVRVDAIVAAIEGDRGVHLDRADRSLATLAAACALLPPAAAPAPYLGTPALTDRGYRCCGKPQGCTNTDPGCAYLRHPYKRWVLGEITLQQLQDGARG